MRWDKLFDDLEGQLEQELTAEEVDLKAEEERLRLGRLGLRDRIVSIHEACHDDHEYVLRLALCNGETISVRPSAFGRDWFSAVQVEESRPQRQCVVPLAAIASLSLSKDQVALSLDSAPGEAGSRSLAARLSLSFVLRDLCRRRSAIEVRTLQGAVFGTIDRVGRDHLDVAVHERGSARRQSAVSNYAVIPLDQIALVRV